MKIGILTFHAVPNYGAVLQAYALQEYLKGLGHEVCFIDYRPAYLTTGGWFHWPKSRWHLKANVVIAYQKLMALKGAFSPAMCEQNARFREFTETYLSLTPRRYRNMPGLVSYPPQCDVYIAGSDQIWNPSEQNGLDSACFLNFGPASVIKVTYAASFGRSEIPPRHHGEVASYAKALDAISVREASGCQLLKEYSGREATLVPDPTFLIDWDTPDPGTQSRTQEKGTLFSYVLRSGDGLYAFQQELGYQLNLDVIQPHNPHQRWNSYGAVVPMSPMEWLAAIRNSSAVVTNSFHGTVFAILFNRPFLSVKLGGAKAGLNARMQHLLNELGLEERQVALSGGKEAVEKMQSSIDWDRVNKRIAEMRDDGIDFLARALDATIK